MKLHIPGLNRREVLFNKTEAQFLRDYLNSLHWKNTSAPKMRLASKIGMKLDALTYARQQGDR